MPKYEYQFGVYIEADDEQQAWDKVWRISAALDALDVDGESVVEGPMFVEE